MNMRILWLFNLIFIGEIYITEQGLYFNWDTIISEEVKGDEQLETNISQHLAGSDNMMEMENYAIYKPVNDLLLEATKTQEKWNKMEDIIRKTKITLTSDGGTDRKMFDELWDKWSTKMSERQHGGGYLGPLNNKYLICDNQIYQRTEREVIEEIYKFSIFNAAKPLDHLSQHVNQTLKDLIPQLNLMKNLITLRLKHCETKESEKCKEKVNNWAITETKRYKSKMGEINPNLRMGSIMPIVQTVSDDIRKFKHDYLKILNEKKKQYLCCLQNVMFESECEIIQEKHFFMPITFGGEIASQEKIEEATTTQMIPTTKNNQH